MRRNPLGPGARGQVLERAGKTGGRHRLTLLVLLGATLTTL